MIDEVCRELSVNEKPDESVSGVFLSIDTDSAVSVSDLTGDGSFLDFLPADVPSKVFSVVDEELSDNFSGDHVLLRGNMSVRFCAPRY